MSRREEVGSYVPDWLFRFTFGPLAVCALVAFTWFVARNQPPPRPSALQQELTQQAQELFAAGKVSASTAGCKYLAKTVAILSCPFAPSKASSLQEAALSLGWSGPIGERVRGWGDARASTAEFTHNSRTLILSCYMERDDCQLELLQRFH
jgi:hypothetical protein